MAVSVTDLGFGFPRGGAEIIHDLVFGSGQLARLATFDG
jgi:hypothetical protein